ncbi:hypothetical protein [Mycobacteroides abscessus]|uniref:hypothetical protein n=1 Tax=Mycobacteroides abscessus TaxID=36809 RepID=UPI000C262E3B|nr:hypothetical protein [Mycobacteroides abscessus]
MSGEISALAVFVSVAYCAVLSVVAVLLLAETVQFFGWMLARLTIVQDERAASKGFAIAGATACWLMCSLLAGSLGAHYLLSLDSGAMMWGAIAGIAPAWLWWNVTARLVQVRRRIRRAADLPAGPWRWMMRGWIVQRAALVSDK